ncbi:unnamed protein product [Heterobilharzia americana]|nr:unnamed protein product [Heterobilharzia americana]
MCLQREWFYDVFHDRGVFGKANYEALFWFTVINRKGLRDPKLALQDVNLTLVVSNLFDERRGQDIYRSGNKVADECDDRIRRLAERCSLANSFQLFVDAEDGFTGIGFRLLENITEEFPKAFIFSVPIYNTSIVSRMNMRLQKIASVNQLCLLNILESSGDFLSHGCWLPMDISELSDHHHSCQKMSVLASVLDTITTPSKLAHKLGGLNLGNLFSMTSYTQGRKMLTVQTGVCCDTASDDQLSWYNLNPYYNQGKRIFGESMSPQPVLWRQFTSRGIKDSILIDSLWKICNETNDSNKFVKNSVDSLDIPFLCASGLARSIYTLPDYPLQTSAMKQVNPLAHCKQYTNTYAACIVDAPNTNSYESKTLEKLVKSLLPHKSHPLDSFMEVETWNDFLESVQTRLVDSYTRE